MSNEFIPNSFQTPNAYVDRIMPLLSGDEYKVLSYAARRIFGFQKRADRISLSQFATGVVNHKTGERVDYGTGLSVATCRQAVHTLVAYGVLIEQAPNDPHTNRGPLYTLQLDAATVDFAGLDARREEASARNTERTAPARARRKAAPSAPVDAAAVAPTPLCGTTGAMSDNTPLCPTVPPPLMSHSTTPPYVGQQHNNQGNPGKQEREISTQRDPAPATAPGPDGDGDAWPVVTTLDRKALCTARYLAFAQAIVPGVTVTPMWLAAEFAAYRDSVADRGKRSADWGAGWRAWLRRVPQFDPGRGRASPPPETAPIQINQPGAAALRARLAAERQEGA